MTPLKYARAKTGLSMNALAKEANVYQMQVQRIEGGRPASPDVAKKLIAVVGEYITLMDLLCPKDFIAPKRKRRKAA